jgi:hypothetical protein
MVVRLLLRDEKFQHLLMSGDGDGTSLSALCQLLSELVLRHFSSSRGTAVGGQLNTDLLKEVTSEDRGVWRRVGC